MALEQELRTYILRHNYEAERAQKGREKKEGGETVNGMAWAFEISNI